MEDAQELSHFNWRNLQFEWRRVQEGWHGSTKAHFTVRFWDPLEYEMKDYLKALDYLIEVLREAQQEARRRST
jgi:uncharacterized protein YukE